MIDENERAAQFLQAIQRDAEHRRSEIVKAIDAETAAWPRISAPTMLTACPARGKRSPASRMISNRKWIISASTTNGNGVE